MTPDEIRLAREAAYGQRYGTHIPLLASVIAKARPGAVFEIGTGHASAPLCAEMCKANGRGWAVWETDEEWFSTVTDLGPLVRIHEGATVLDCAVAFIDCLGWDRVRWINAMRNVAEYIVVHDTDNPAHDLNDMMDALSTFTYRYDYKVMTPWTTVVSMTRAYP